MALEPRQLSALNEMGIPVWGLRTQLPVEILPIVDIAETSIAEIDENLLQRDWLILVDQPTISEQAQRLLDAMLLAIGLMQQHVTIVTSKQLSQLQQLSAARKIILSLGSKNSQLLLGESTKLDSHRGKVHQVLTPQFTTIVSFGLEELLEFPQYKILAWQDLLLAKATYEQRI
ncbi:MAG: hypothetical protein COB23_07680 [Methylophaga sp.]|nr:MAG: hypothetical protein COB23_07680 [Methylophaga sp.]